ncbi:SCO family protein [Sulfurimonas sp.]|nr:SCO family protein [Sulfurimonas sp.]
MDKLKYILLPILLLLVIFLISFSGNFTDSIGVIKVDKKIESKVFYDYDNDIIFVFFGYVGCTNICTPRLNEIVPIYKELKKNSIDVKTIFINMKKFDDRSLPLQFAKAFHNEFTGLYMEDNELYSLQSEFNVVNVPSMVEDGEYNHTSFLFLLKKTHNGMYTLRRIYTYVPYDKETIVKDIKANFSD